MVSREEVKHLAWLARMELTDQELEAYADQVGEILGYLSSLDAIALDEIKPVKNVMDHSKLREDRAIGCEAETLGVAKNRKGRFVKAPKMV